MKQRRLGRKIQNWHRPLGPSDLGQRYLRKRHDDPEYTERGRLIDASVEVDDCWDCYDPREADWLIDEQQAISQRLKAVVRPEESKKSD